jgi:hypothetical protein
LTSRQLDCYAVGGYTLANRKLPWASRLNLSTFQALRFRHALDFGQFPLLHKVGWIIGAWIILVVSTEREDGLSDGRQRGGPWGQSLGRHLGEALVL